ncbi:MAG: winged helix-turn-helix transcriptional regulator [Solirubrobacteraceae bacterium]|nr:winged helix-turn-helix transcriptional regulator [Solirubrobacteraceae bacterium]
MTPPADHDPLDDHLDALFSALADRTRREILRRLVGGDVTVAELTAGFPISQPAVSKHLQVLERAGLVSRTRQGTARLSHLEAAPMRTASDYLGTYREYWEESFSRLDQLLAAQPPSDPPTSESKEQP